MKKFVRLSSSFKNCSILLRKNQGIYKKNHLFCAVSGGQDSIVSFFLLFHILSLSKKLSSLENVYCQHFWQTKNFFCSEFLFQLSFLVEVPYTLILSKNILVSENRAREWRKKSFSRFLQLQKLSTVVLGHTKSDNLEKNLTHLLRGTSPKSFSQLTLFHPKKRTSFFFYFLIFKPKNSFFFFNHVTSIKHWNDLFIFYVPITRKKSYRGLKRTKPNYFRALRSNLTKRALRYSPPTIIGPLPLISSKRRDPVLKTTVLGSNALFKKQYQTSFFPVLNGKGTERKRKESTCLFLFKKNISYSFCFSNKNRKNPKTYLKPLENLDRFDVSNLIKLYRFPMSNDITNFLIIFYRNKIRHLFLPFIRFLFEMRFESLLLNFLCLVRGEHQQVENEIFELRMVLKFIRIKYLKKK